MEHLPALAGIVVISPIAIYAAARMATKAYFFSKLEFLTKVKTKGWQ
ncbi:hypothetical protein F862_gp074 [Vibrio phage vB_VpaS_MAR10]|uniref:Uncharacterized protein n=1 Tax=Vibrio phage vB_VpaS_MAR10 TaxID=1229755 RepID=K7R6H5_9CAUD|nr:hypothetical protein F862_gp074 [Vibrio phage vB_VpaS_MAR10]AFV81306.1 hypothetical protein MAR10_072 [Vibrio phage vB_VpaS_MAR10]AXH68402.1 hypothetical protein [Vibrio phage R01]